MYNNTEHNNVVVTTLENGQKLYSVNKTADLIYNVDETIEAVKAFAERKQMTANSDEKIRKALQNGNNVRLCNYGKTDTCHTVSVWYAPKRYNDFGVRIEKHTLENLKRAKANTFILEHAHKGMELAESSKDNEVRYSFKAFADVVQFLDTLQENYRTYIKETKQAIKSASAESVSA